MPKRNAKQPAHRSRRSAPSLSSVRRELVRRVTNAAAHTVDPLREGANRVAREVALSLDTYWERSKRAPAGPIDVIDMFSGCGGMSAGFLALNGLITSYRLLAALDIDETANATYAKNLGTQPHNIDVSELARDGSGQRRILPDCGKGRTRPLVLIGCAPCQGFSSHRNEAGRHDDRNSLFVDFARIAARLQPDAIVVENVPELLTERYWHFLVRGRRVLEGAGYFVHVGVHNMAEFGVPQERFRALLLAMKRPFAPIRGFLVRPDFRTVRDAIESLPRIAAGERLESDPMHFTAHHRPSTLSVIRAVPKNGGSRPDHVGPDCLRRARQRSGRAAYEDVYGRLHWDRPAITVTAYARNPASGRYVHPEQDRGLSIREAASLQGFPRDYTFTGSLDDAFRQIGNAVPPRFAAYVAGHLLGELLSSAPSPVFAPGVTTDLGPSFSRLIPALKAGYRQNVHACIGPAVN